MTDETGIELDDVAEESDQYGGIVHCSPEFAADLGDLAKLFDPPAPLREAARFAMAIGIQTDARMPREEWPKGKARNIAHLNGQFDDAGRYDYALIFEMLGLMPDGVALNVLISEYISGGMKWIKEHELSTGTNFRQLRESFPMLFRK